MSKIKKITIILTIILVSLVSFAGVYVKNQNRMENKVKNYEYDMKLSGYRQLVLSVNNIENELTDEQLNNAKQIIQNRLEKLGATQYIVKVNKQNIVIQIPEDENTNYIVSNIYAAGKFEIVDSATGEVLLNNDDIETAQVMYDNSSSSGTTVILDIEFDKEGKEKLSNITNEYKTVEKSEEETSKTDTTESKEQTTDTTETTSEEQTEETSGESTQKEITMKIDEEEILTQSFDEPITTGKFYLTFGSATSDEGTIQSYIQSATSLATILSEGMLPTEYTLSENEYIYATINNEQLVIVAAILFTIVIIAFIVLAIRYKALAIFAGISYIGFMAIYLLVIRYANTVITIEAIGGIVVLMILNFILIQRMLKDGVGKQTYIKFILDIISVLIISVIFSFIKWEPIASCGMIMFWGLLLTVIYHKLVTETLLKIN